MPEEVPTAVVAFTQLIQTRVEELISPEFIRLSRTTSRILWQNIAIALGIKAAVFGMTLAGHGTMWLAVFADMGASLIVVFNGLRLLRMPSCASGRGDTSCNG